MNDRKRQIEMYAAAQRLANIRQKLIHAATVHDRRRANKPGYNPHALGQYFARIEQAIDDMANGTKPRDAITKNFNDRLRDALLVAIGETKYEGH